MLSDHGKEYNTAKGVNTATEFNLETLYLTKKIRQNEKNSK